MRTGLAITGCLLLVSAAGCGETSSGTSDMAPTVSPLCTGVASPCVGFASTATEKEISAAFVTAVPKTTFVFAAATYKFQNSLNLAHVAGITIKGAGSDKTDATKKTVLDFSTVVGSGEGIVADGTDDLLFIDLIAQDTKGNGIKVLNSNGVTFRNVRTLWTNPDNHTHGAYGVYPVQCKNVLIENCEVAGAADAGIYVGQSDHIIVRNNDVHDNVAGIEIENSSYSDVYDNKAHDNVGGILIFNMPDLEVNEGGFHHVYKNTIDSNNTVNFAKRGSSVARVPGGTGAFILAGHDVEFDRNTFTNNEAAAFSIISYVITGDARIGMPGALKYGYDKKLWPSRVYVHDNTFMGNGKGDAITPPKDCPDPTAPNAPASCPDATAWQLSQILYNAKLFVTSSPGIADTVYDGVLDASATTMTWGGTKDNPMNICLGSNMGMPVFLNLKIDVTGPLLESGDQGKQLQAFSMMSKDPAPHACTLPALPAVMVTAR